jgi:hypothetical protein
LTHEAEDGRANDNPVSYLNGIRKWLAGRGERGASGLEYGLVMALMLVGSTASFEMMDENIEDYYEESAENIGRADLSYFDVTTTACQSSCGTTTTTTTTTEPPTTTTTAPPTTTTTTTTTVPSTHATSQLTDLSYEAFSGWKAKARIELDLPDGSPLAGAEVTVTWTDAEGDTRTRSYTTNSAGKTGPTWGRRDGDKFPMTFTIDSVTYDGESWTVSDDTITLNAW